MGARSECAARVSQGLTWSTTVIMKIDLVGPARRGLAMGLNEFAGYVAVAASRSLRVSSLHTEGCAGARSTSASFSLPMVSRSRCSWSGTRSRTSSSSRRCPASGHPNNARHQREVFWRTTCADREPLQRHPGRPRQQPQQRLAWGLFPLFFCCSEHQPGKGRSSLPSILPPGVSCSWGQARFRTRIGRKGASPLGCGRTAESGSPPCPRRSRWAQCSWHRRRDGLPDTPGRHW